MWKKKMELYCSEVKVMYGTGFLGFEHISLASFQVGEAHLKLLKVKDTFCFIITCRL